MFRRHEGKGEGISPVLWWIVYFVVALWAQELSGGFDFLAPGLLVCLQIGQWWSLIWMTWFVIFMQEGMGDLVFGSSLLFYAGMYLAFLFSRWLLEPRNPFFIFFFSLLLSVWHWLVLSGGRAVSGNPRTHARPVELDSAAVAFLRNFLGRCVLGISAVGPAWVHLIRPRGRPFFPGRFFC